MENNDISNRIKNVLRGNKFQSVHNVLDSINGDTSLINDLALDSIQILELIVSLEKEFMFACEPYELNIDMFDRFDELVAFIKHKCEQKAQC